MNEKVGRNDPCPCGSGKKYKKCCGQNDVVLINRLIENEMDDLQNQIVEYAITHYGIEIENDFDELISDLYIPDEEEQTFYEFIHTIWFTLFRPLDDGRTILERFIAVHSSNIRRPKLRQILQSWTGSIPVAGKIISLEKDYLVAEDALSAERYKVALLNDQYRSEEGAFLFAMLLPYNDQYVAFPVPIDLPKEDAGNLQAFLNDYYSTSGYDSTEQFITDFFLELISEAPYIGKTIEIDYLEWDAPIYKEVAELFQKEMVLVGEVPAFINAGTVLWNQFCRKRPKRIKNPSIYAASLQYLVSLILPTKVQFTQKELAEKYGVSPNSISSAYGEMDVVLAEDITKLLNVPDDDMLQLEEWEDADFGSGQQAPEFAINKNGAPMLTERVMQEAFAELEGKDFTSIEEVNEFLNQTLNQPKKAARPKSDRALAQELVYDAVEAQGKKRYQLAKKALELYPHNADAYLILAEQARTLKEEAELYKKGMEVGKEDLGEEFFEKNAGYFWGIMETRPFMRAKFNYAGALHRLGIIQEAIHHYEELLKLNEHDNQGVRFSLFNAYVESGELGKAKKLHKQYENGTAQSLFNELLLELLEKGVTVRAARLLKEAKAENRYIPDYLTGKMKLPVEAPMSYSLGDRNEAIIYAIEHKHLWNRVPGVRDWLQA